MNKLSNEEIEFITKCLKEGKTIPESYRYIIPFETKKEYELTYDGKEREEDILADTMAVPLQPVKNFDNGNGGWANKLIFGDNLQVLKALMDDPEVYDKNTGRGKVRLIYIDPPFATKQEFRGSQDQKAYQDKIVGAQFLEFLRKRLIFLRELLADDGSIYVHLDWKKAHYVKSLMDEIFGEHNFKNEIIWRRTFAGKTISRNIPQNADLIFWYVKTDHYLFNPMRMDLTEKDIKQFNKDDSDGRGRYTTVSLQKVAGPTPGTSYNYIDNQGRVWKCPSKGWRMTKDKLKQLENDGRLYITDKTIREKYYLKERLQKGKQVDNIWTDIGNLNRSPNEIVQGTSYAHDYPFDKILVIVKNSLRRIGEKGNLISQENRQRILQAFGVVRRKRSKSLRYKIESENLFVVNTADIKKNSLGLGTLRRESSIFYDDYSSINGEDDDKKLLKEIIGMFRDGQLHSASLIKVGNTFNFKTPLNIVFASHKPERDFIRRLVSEENAKKIDAWIKSLDVEFYSVEYSWRKGEHPKQGSFNPDFFIKIGEDILAVEIKADSDVSNENKAKLRYARQHFDRLDGLQSKYRYYFNFLSPSSYDLFFQDLRRGKYKTFKSDIEAKLDDLDRASL